MHQENHREDLGVSAEWLRIQSYVQALIRGRLSGHDREDACQEVMLGLHRARTRMTRIANLGGFTAGITRAVVARCLVDLARRRLVQSLDDLMELDAGGDESYLHVPVEADERMEQDRGRLTSLLTAQQLRLIELSLAGHDLSSIARALGLRRSNVRAQLQAILKRLSAAAVQGLRRGGARVRGREGAPNTDLISFFLGGKVMLNKDFC